MRMQAAMLGFHVISDASVVGVARSSTRVIVIGEERE